MLIPRRASSPAHRMPPAASKSPRHSTRMPSREYARMANAGSDRAAYRAARRHPIRTLLSALGILRG